MTNETNPHAAALLPRIEGRIQIVRDLRVVIDVDLAALYGVPPKRPIGFLTDVETKVAKAMRATKAARPRKA